MKYQITEVSIDAVLNVAVNGFYNDGGVQIGGGRVFHFDLDNTPHSNKTEFLQAVKTRLELSQPFTTQEELDAIALAEQARDLLTEYIGNNITLNPVE